MRLGSLFKIDMVTPVNCYKSWELTIWPKGSTLSSVVRTVSLFSWARCGGPHGLSHTRNPWTHPTQTFDLQAMRTDHLVKEISPWTISPSCQGTSSVGELWLDPQLPQRRDHRRWFCCVLGLGFPVFFFPVPANITFSDFVSIVCSFFQAPPLH